MYRHQWVPAMKIYCIFSDERVFHLKSPAIFSTVLKRMGIKGNYVPFKVNPQDIGKAIQSLKVLHIAGANVTVPYKEVVVPHMNILSEGANIIGAVNTIVCKEDTLKGYNTNAIGFMDTLFQEGISMEGKSALVVGTGGAAKAVIFILNWLRSEMIYVSGRNESQAQALVERFGGQVVSFEQLGQKALPVHLVVNATSVSSPGESPEMAALAAKIKLTECELLIDLNYGRDQNMWQETANGNRVRFMDGLMPLAHQARRTFALWTGMQVPPEEFLRAADANL